MKRTINFFIEFALFFVAVSASAQGTFQNLDFESATLGAPVTGPLGPVYQQESLVLPDWSAYLGSTPLNDILQNEATLNEATVDIMGPTTPPVVGQFEF